MKTLKAIFLLALLQVPQQADCQYVIGYKTETVLDTSDNVRPAPPVLVLDSTGNGTMYLRWTAVGDDSLVGTADAYDIRYSARSLSTGDLLTNRDFALNVSGWSMLNSPGVLGWSSTIYRTASGSLVLTSGGEYIGAYASITTTSSDSVVFTMYMRPSVSRDIDAWVLDQDDNVIGGFTSVYLSAGTWTQLVVRRKLSGVQTGIKVGFNWNPGASGDIMYIDDATCTIGREFAFFTEATGEPSPSSLGSSETFTLTGLGNGVPVYVAMTAIDGAGNVSAVSNAVVGTPTVPPDTVETIPRITTGDIWVHKGGNDGNSGNDSAHAYLTIQTAINNASAGDTIVVCAGTYAEKLTASASGTFSLPIVLAGYSGQLVTVTGSSSASDGNCLYLSGDYWTVQGLTFLDQTRATSNSGYFWVNVTGDHNTLQWIRLPGEPTANNTRLLYFGGKYTSVLNSFFRGGSEGIVLDGSTPRYYRLDGDTIYNTTNNNLILGGAGATVGTYHAGLVQNCVLDTAGEDNIQLQNNGAAELSNNGILIWKNVLANAQENAIDMKSCGPTVAVEDNVLVNSYGNDTDGGNDDNGGAGIELGAQDVCRYGLVRFNIIGGNHTGSRMYPGFHIFHNTFYNNSHSYRGFSSTSGEYAGLETDNVSEDGEWKRLINNIFYDESGNSNRWTLRIIKANASRFEINSNLYYQTGGSARFETNYPSDWTDPDTYTGLVAWRAALTASAFDGWSGKDSISIEADPLFVDVPANPGAYDSSWDFSLDTGSPAIGAGKALTTTTNTGTNSTSLTVVDPYFFRTDYGIPLLYSGVTGDSIQIGSADPVEITGIDYSTGELTLSAQRTWTNGASVWLWKNGAKVDDIGSKQN